VRTTSIDQVFNPIDVPELGSQELYHESYFLWLNPERTVTLEDFTALYRYQYGENFTFKTPSRYQTPFGTSNTQRMTNMQVDVLRYQQFGEETKHKFPVKSLKKWLQIPKRLK